MNIIPDKFQDKSKAVVAAIGVVLAAVLQGINALPDGWQNSLSGLALILTPIVTYWIPNIEKFIDDDPDDQGVDDVTDSNTDSEPTDADLNLAGNLNPTDVPQDEVG